MDGTVKISFDQTSTPTLRRNSFTGSRSSFAGSDIPVRRDQNFKQFLNKTKYEKKTLEQNVLYKIKCSQSIIKGEIGLQSLWSSFSSS